VQAVDIGYSGFILIFNIEPEKRKGWWPGLDLRDDGVYVTNPEPYEGCFLTKEEHAILTEHPNGNLSKPVLSFPCSKKELGEFINFYGLEGCYDEEALACFKDEPEPERVQATQQANEIKDPDSFMCDLKVSYLDNTEVKIQYKGKRKNYTCESMGFRDCNTEEWKTFLKILEATDYDYREHNYCLGPAHYINKETHTRERIGEYDRKLNLLKEIDKKIIAFLAKQYNVTFPAGFKSYERQPAKGNGVYSFKFQMPSATATPSYKTKDQALKYLEVLVRDRASQELINEACLTAIKEGASKDEVSRIVKDKCLLRDEDLEAVDDLENDDEDELD